jgi:UDP-N-acetylmuramoyl-tripeptide--D-alanyl-D-alanine ligase
MQALWQALPPARRGGYAESATRIEPVVLAALRPGDVVMIKGSNASRLHMIVASLRDRFAVRAAAQNTTA